MAVLRYFLNNSIVLGPISYAIYSLVSLSISLISSLFNLTSTGYIILSLSTIDIPTFIPKEARNVKHIPPPRRI